MGTVCAKPAHGAHPLVVEPTLMERSLKAVIVGAGPEDSELVYSDGSRYFGKLVNQRPHGFGKAFFVTGELYFGEW